MSSNNNNMKVSKDFSSISRLHVTLSVALVSMLLVNRCNAFPSSQHPALKKCQDPNQQHVLECRVIIGNLISLASHRNEAGSNLPMGSSDNECASSFDVSRRQSVSMGLMMTMVGLSSSWQSSMAFADEDVTTTTQVDPPTASAVAVVPCVKRTSGPTNCISTANVKQVDLYAPPWTFDDVSAKEVIARLKGVVVSDPNLELLSVEGDVDAETVLLQVRAVRGFAAIDNLEFVINPLAKVVTFRCEQGNDASVSDFGAIRKQMESIRQRAGILSIMGEGFSADSVPKQNGPGAQLKAFFGLQSGQGFEDVFNDEEDY